MSKAQKYMLLALAAFKERQFEEAGVLFAQSASCDDVNQLTNALMEPVDQGYVPSDEVPLGDGSLLQLADGDVAEEDDDDFTPDDSGEGVLDDEGDMENAVSSSSSRPRRQSVVRRPDMLGKIIAASMEATASEDDEDDEEEEFDDGHIVEVDPDLPGEDLIPSSFSRVSVRGPVVKSPVRFRVKL